MIKRVLIIGAYGNFGSRITEKLSAEPDLQVVIAGRSEDKCRALATRLQTMPNPPVYQVLDIDKNFSSALEKAAPDIVVHTSGPFQGQGYAVAEACIEYGCHYIDLADGRDFVEGFGRLDARAREKNICLITGASSVPALTSAIVDAYLPQFKKLVSLDYAITTAHLTNTGLATTSAILSYSGMPIKTLVEGSMQTVYGWQDLHSRYYPELGRRLLGNCDIPDLALFPQRYKSLKNVRFYAGNELKILHLGHWALSWLVRSGFISNLAKFAKSLLRLSRLFDFIGHDKSGFHMEMRGTGHDGKPHKITYYIIAGSGHGPFIPSIPAILCTQMLARGEITAPGAWPCMGVITLSQYTAALKEMDISISVTEDQR